MAEYLNIIVLIVLAIIFHEAAHRIAIHFYTGKWAKFKSEKMKWDEGFLKGIFRQKGGWFGFDIPYGLTKEQEATIVLAGVFAGLLPFTFVALPYNTLIILLVVYGLGCNHDMRLLAKIIEEKK